MQTEVTITIKGEDSTFKKKYLCYDILRIDHEDSNLRKMIDQTLAEYKGISEEILIKVTARL